MSDCGKLTKVVTAIYQQIELTMLEAQADSKIADRFTLRMSFHTLQCLMFDAWYRRYLYIDLDNIHASTLAGYSIVLQKEWSEEHLIYLHYELAEQLRDLSKVETAFGQMQVAVPFVEKCSRGVEFEW